MENRATEGRFIGITFEAVLRPCEIYPVPSGSRQGFVWEWSSVSEPATSKRCFDMFFDCLEDARRHGYEPHFLDRGVGDLAVVAVTATG
jgi:hypothetical protein